MHVLYNEGTSLESSKKALCLYNVHSHVFF